MAKQKKMKNWIIPAAVGSVVMILTVASIVSGSIQQKKEKESNVANVSVDRINLKDDNTQVQQVSSAKTEVEIQFEDCAVPVGTQLKMMALVVPENTEQALVWSSADSSILEIDRTGVLTVKGVGTAVVTATVGTVSDSVVIEGIENVAQGSKNNFPVYTGTTLAQGMGSGSTSSGNSSDGSSSADGSQGGGNTASGGADTDSSGSGAGGENGNPSDGSGGASGGSTSGGGNSSGGSTGGNSDSTDTSGSSSDSSSSGDSSTDISDGLSDIGFTQRYSNVYVCEENGSYYGEIITQPNVTIIYIKQRSTAFDSRIQTVIQRLLPEEYGQVWSNYLSAATDRTFTAEGRRVRIVVAPNGGHSQIVIYN